MPTRQGFALNAGRFQVCMLLSSEALPAPPAAQHRWLASIKRYNVHAYKHHKHDATYCEFTWLDAASLGTSVTHDMQLLDRMTETWTELHYIPPSKAGRTPISSKREAHRNTGVHQQA